MIDALIFADKRYRTMWYVSPSVHFFTIMKGD